MHFWSLFVELLSKLLVQFLVSIAEQLAGRVRSLKGAENRLHIFWAQATDNIQLRVSPSMSVICDATGVGDANA